MSVLHHKIFLFSLFKKNSEKVLFFDSSATLNVKGKIVADELILNKQVKIDISHISGMDDYLKTNQVIGDIATQNNTGFLISSSGALKSNGAELYNATINTSNLIVKNGGIQIQNDQNKSILWVSDSGEINSPDAWGNAGNLVLSDEKSKIKLLLNGEKLEIWVDKNLIVSLPKGFSPNIEN